MSEDAAVDRTPDKTALRARLLAARRTRTPAAIEAARRAVAGHVLAEAGRQGWRRVAAYEPLRSEPGSLALLEGLRTRGIEVIVPITRPDHDLDWTSWPPSSDGSGPGLGLHAVGAIDAVLAPALAVGRDGTRLGRGGGSYDRALGRIGPGTSVFALVYAEEVLAQVPTDLWDRPVDAAVTPQGIVWLSSGE